MRDNALSLSEKIWQLTIMSHANGFRNWPLKIINIKCRGDAGTFYRSFDKLIVQSTVSLSMSSRSISCANLVSRTSV